MLRRNVTDRLDPSAIRTTCPYCGVGCGVVATPDGRGGAGIAGDGNHPANLGRLCSKGAALGETLSLEGRLLKAEIDGRPVALERALDAAADGFARTLRDDGPGAIAVYLSGQLLTEDYYVANKLMKGFIGSGNVDTNSRLCMASSVAGHRRAFGSDSVPGTYEDLEQADLVVLAGSNLAWCHPVLFQRLLAAKQRRPGLRIVVVDPRRTASCEGAALHLALRPGSDAVLFNGLLVHLAQQGAERQDYVERCTAGAEGALEAARATAPSAAAVAAACALEARQVAQFFALFAATERVVTVYSQGINQSSSGTDKVNAIINCHLLTGRIGRPGMGPFSVTGQPNAMGGREVGALANQLAAHMDFDRPGDVDRVRRFWRAGRMAERPGLKAVELFRAIEEGRVKALWIMATNPLVSLPDSDGVRQALARCPLVVVSDCERATDTTAFANILLPALAWGEKDGTVTNSERRISRQRTFLPAPGDAKQDWWLVSEVARRMGFGEAFAYRSAAAIFREHAALSAFENDGSRDFDIGGLAELNDAGYDRLAPVQWPYPRATRQSVPRLFSDGGFFTADARARFIAVTPRDPVNAACETHPFLLNTGRVRDQWHTMTRTGKSPRLSTHCAEPTVEIHPEDALRIELADGDLATLASRWGRMVARVRLTDDQAPGRLFVPMHWNDQFAGQGRVNTLVNPETDPISGQPESKSTPVRVEVFRPPWYGFALSHRPLAIGGDFAYWVRAIGMGFWRYELADGSEPAAARRRLRALIAGDRAASGEWLDYSDPSAGRFRSAYLVDGRLEACLSLAPQPDTTSRERLGALFSSGTLSARERRTLLAGWDEPATVEAAPVVCACFGVSRDRILAAAQARNLRTADAIGTALRAGTNCGSCLPEIRRLIGETRTVALSN